MAGRDAPFHGDEKLHRRTIRKHVMDRFGVQVVSHIDGSIDVDVPSGADPREFARSVEQFVRGLGYMPSVGVRGDRTGPTVVISTAETVGQAGRGAHHDQ